MKQISRSLLLFILASPLLTAQIINGSFVTYINDSLYSVTIEVNLQSESGTAGIVQIEFSFNSASLSYPFVPQKDIDYILHGDFDLYQTQNITRPTDDKIRISLLTLGTPSPVPIDTSATDLITFYFKITGNNGTSDLIWLQTDIAPAFLQGNYEIGSWLNLDEQLPIWTSISIDEKMPGEYKLFQNYPNPFNPSTKIKYALPQSSKVNLTVYNAIGEVVIALVNEVQDEGFHEIELDATNLPSGIYLYRLAANENIQVKKMILLK